MTENSEDIMFPIGARFKLPGRLGTVTITGLYAPTWEEFQRGETRRWDYVTRDDARTKVIPIRHEFLVKTAGVERLEDAPLPPAFVVEGHLNGSE